MKFQSEITEADVMEAEKVRESWNVTRRAALMMVARNSDDIELDDDSAEAFAELLESVGDYVKWCESETEIMKSAEARLIIVLRNYLEKAA